MLPKGAKVIATAVADDRIAVTIEQGGTVEVRTFDLKTLQPPGGCASPPSRERLDRPPAGRVAAAACLPAGSGLFQTALPDAPFV